jgi:hypothetical protein
MLQLEDQLMMLYKKNNRCLLLEPCGTLSALCRQNAGFSGVQPAVCYDECFWGRNQSNQRMLVFQKTHRWFWYT